MNTVYDRKYQNLALDIAKESGYESFIRHGCYCMFSGPTYETVAELRLAAAVSSHKFSCWTKFSFRHYLLEFKYYCRPFKQTKTM